MRHKKILLTCVAVVAVVSVTLVLKFHIARRVSLASAYSRRTTLQQTYEHLSEHGPEITSLHTKMMLLGAYRHSEALLSHPLAPWWPQRTRGSYERMPYWKRPSRQEQFDRIHADHLEFLSEIGVTNSQTRAELFKRYVELMREANKTNGH